MDEIYQTLIAGRLLTLKTGELAQQANGSVLVQYGDTIVLTTVCAAKEATDKLDFVPLTVDYEEKLYAAGKIPGSFLRREGRPTTEAILTCRFIDRGLRPLLSKNFNHETQIISTVLSADMENSPDICAVIGASAALTISDIPFEGPLSAVHVGYINGEFVLNPLLPQIESCLMDVSVVSTENEMVMVEADANEISEEVILEAIKFGHQANLAIIELQKKLQKDYGKTKAVPAKKEMPSELSDRIKSILESKLDAILGHSDKTIRNQQLSALQEDVFNECTESYGENEIGYIFDTTLKKEIRTRILSRKEHIDGRKHDEIRDISCKVGLLPRTHGSALFARGATQVLTITTLGSTRQEQLLDGLSLEDSKHYMHHYNFPPFSTGEVKRTGSPGRREIGHGALAERALLPVLPSEEEFRYTIRLVSEVLSSNGSTSMASTCGSSLALMDAGVPIKAPVAGIAMGLITGENGDHVVLTDIEGLEDFNGDMDFKVAGTRDGITALQLDIKLKGMNIDILAESMTQAQKARFEILDKMAQEIEASRPEISPYAPKIQEITIDTSKIGIVIGPGGKTIRAITDQTGASIDIKDDGKIIIASPNDESAQKALKMIDELTREVKVDDVFTGKVTRIFNFGAMVEILPGKEGLVHVSELSDHYVKNIEDEVKEGEEITVKVIEIDNMGRVNLSHKAIIQGSSYVRNSSNDKDRSSTGFRRSTQKRPSSRQGRSSNRYHNDDERNR